MGFIASLGKNKALHSSPLSPRSHQTSRGRWREIFGSTHKERGGDENTEYKKPIPGGSWGRSTVSSSASIQRLVQALRSMAPGGWSDDRLEQGNGRHFVGIAYIAIHRIATQWLQAEFQVFKKDRQHPDGKRPITEDDPVEGDRLEKPYRLVQLLEKPNKQDSFGKFLYRLAQQKYLTGTALTWMLPNELGTPCELYCIPTAVAVPQPAVNPDYPDGYYRIQPMYPYGPFSSYPTPASAVGAAIPAQWILRFQYPHPLLRYEGYSPLTGMRYSLDVIESIYRSRWYAMKRSINPSATLDLSDLDGMEPWVEAELERVRADFEIELQGPENAGKLFIPPPGGRLEPWGGRPVDMDYATGYEQETSTALAGFGITKPAAGMVEDASYATLYATLKQLHVLTVGPDLYDVAAELTRHLAPFFGDDLIVEIRCPRIDDHDLKLAKCQYLGNGRALTKNEARKEMDLPLTTEKWGNDIYGDPTPLMQQPPPGEGGGMGGLEALLGGGNTAGGQGGRPTNQEAVANGQKMPPEQGMLPQEDVEVNSNRPRTGALGAGSRPMMGRKSLSLYEEILEECEQPSRITQARRNFPLNGKTKSLYQEMMEALSNGNGKH